MMTLAQKDCGDDVIKNTWSCEGRDDLVSYAYMGLDFDTKAEARAYRLGYLTAMNVAKA